MFWRMVKGALLRQKGKMLLIAFTIALGASLSTAMLNVMLDVGDKVNKELKTYGANINVLPKGASLIGDLYGVSGGSGVADKYLLENEIGRIKTIFWAFNIVDFTPYLETAAKIGGNDARLAGVWFNHHLALPTGEELDTGMQNMKNWWRLSGGWLSDADDDGAMLGSLAAERHGVKPGDKLTVEARGRKKQLQVRSVFNAGGKEDEDIYVTLKTAQELSGRPGLVSRIEVSALTTPDNELSRRAAQDPKSLSTKEWETWYCTAYVSAICYQISEVITDSAVKPIRQVAEAEGAILAKTKLLMLLITVFSLAGSALGISNLVTASVLERGSEIGLLKAVGARNFPVSLLVLAQIMIAGLAGGTAGYFAGLGFARVIGHSVFGAAITVKPIVIPLVAVLTLLVILAGSVPAVRMLLALRPAQVLHGR
ncbi:MAG: ABC transporter permease [Acidaminococcales bacterium]|jgi:putative ABC transport system permease protein|nr:ABC transporter permease [Acidaminococcales bacterium]